MEKKIPSTIDEYIAGFAQDIQPLLHSIRNTIVKAAPKATKKISWGMATFCYYGNLVHFSAEKKHIGFHPCPTAIIAFKEELGEYHCSKGTVQFPYNKPLPLDLIDRMVRFRVAEQDDLVKLNDKIYEFDAEIKKVPDIDGAYIEFPYDVRAEFKKGRVKVHAAFDGEPYDGSLVKMKTPCHIIGVQKTIRTKIDKQAGDMVHATIKERA